MFHGIIVNRRKGPAVFWEKEYGSVNSTKYDAIILANIQAFLKEHQKDIFGCKIMPLANVQKRQKSIFVGVEFLI